jgi:hypothetical protein
VGPGCSVSAASSDNFITINGATGAAPGNVAFSVSATSSPGVRTGTITVNGEPITIVQDSRAFTDDPLVSGVTPIRAAHVTELRSRIDGVRQRFQLPAFAYSHSIAAASVIRAADVTEMRTALAQAFAAAGLTMPSFSRTPAPGIPVAAIDISELRTALLAIE